MCRRDLLRAYVMMMPCTDKRDAMMPPDVPWADLNSELLVSVAAAQGLSLRDYQCLRGVCTAWRSAIEPPSYPCILSLAADGGKDHSASVYSLPMRRSFHLQTASSALDDSLDHGRKVQGRARVVGSSNGRFAVAVDQQRMGLGSRVAAFLSCWTERIFVLDPRAGNGDMEIELATPIALKGPCYEYVHKVVFAPGPDNGTVVALYDHKNVAYIDITTSHQKWTNIDLNTVHNLTDLAFDDDGKLYCLDSYGGVHVVRIPLGGHNEPAVVEPLHTAAAFAPPYDIGSALATTKYIFFCHGSLYQMWQNKSATVTSRGFTMPVGEILVLRYDPRRSPCWDAVKDLGGCSVFIGKSNNPAVVRAAGVPRVRADCVYWIDWIRPMECDIATGISKKYVLPYGACIGNCWYFGDDDMTCINGDGRKGRN